MVAVPRCLRATRVRLLRRAPAPHGIPRWPHAARHRASIATRLGAPEPAFCSWRRRPSLGWSRLLRAAGGRLHRGEARVSCAGGVSA